MIAASTEVKEAARTTAGAKRALREHRRAVRARLVELRAKVREAVQAKKARMKEIVRTCREQRRAATIQIREKRIAAKRAITDAARAQRAKLHATHAEAIRTARVSYDSAVHVARAELKAERERQREERRVNREERERTAALKKAHAAGASHHAVRAPMVERLAPLHAKAKAQSGPEESLHEAVLRYAETHPDEAHAVLHPAAEHALEEAEAKLAEATRASVAPPSEAELERAGRVAAKPREKAKKSGPSRAKKNAVPVATNWQPSGYDDRVKCGRCGLRGGLHRANDGRCPPHTMWGAALPDPFSDPSLDGKALDTALAKYWGASKSVYVPLSRRPYVEPAAPRDATAFEEKKAARVQRMQGRSAKLRAEAEAVYAKARAIGDHIPMGQPILVGHHSERRHRRDLKRIDGAYSKAAKLSREAETLAPRARSAERNKTISSDDPNALEKLRAKIADLDEDRARGVAINAAIRKGGDVLAALTKLGLKQDIARKFLEKDFAGRVGVPDYQFKGNSAERRRLEQRVKVLEAQAKAAPKPSEDVGLATISEADNRVRVVFPSIPPEPLRRALKSAGFRWSPTAGAWQRHASHAAWVAARKIAAVTA